MRNREYKQVACISEDNALDFQNKANAVLNHTPAPQVILDKTKPFTMYILYSVSKSEPETILEVLETLSDKSGARCRDCPAFVPDKDKRKKRGTCQLREGTHFKDSPACEFYYLKDRDGETRIVEELKQLPYLIE